MFFPTAKSTPQPAGMYWPSFMSSSVATSPSGYRAQRVRSRIARSTSGSAAGLSNSSPKIGFSAGSRNIPTMPSSSEPAGGGSTFPARSTAASK